MRQLHLFQGLVWGVAARLRMSKWFSNRCEPVNISSALSDAARQIRVRLCCRWWIVVFATVVSGCAMIPVPSHLSVDNQLQIAQPLGKEETILVYGINAEPPERTDNFYFIFQCRHFAFESGWDTPTRLTDSIRNGIPGVLATKGLREELQSMLGADLPHVGIDLKLSDMFAARVLENHVRYLVFVKEKVETTIHVPLYFIPAGVAACGHKTILEAGVWEMPSGKFIGTLTASAGSEFVVLAWMFHLVFIPDTQASAVQKLAQEIMEKLIGSTPDQKTSSQISDGDVMLQFPPDQEGIERRF